jgi:hypothetical protein
MVDVRPTVFHAHIWAGNVLVRPVLSVWVGPLKSLLPKFMSMQTCLDKACPFGSAHLQRGYSNE